MTFWKVGDLAPRVASSETVTRGASYLLCESPTLGAAIMRLLATTLALLPFVPLAAAPIPKTEPVDWKAVIENRQYKPNRVGSKAEKRVAAAREAGLVAEFAMDADGCTGVFVFTRK